MVMVMVMVIVMVMVMVILKYRKSLSRALDFLLHYVCCLEAFKRILLTLDTYNVYIV